MTKLTRSAISLLTLLPLTAALSNAAEITFNGYTNGCFSTACSPPDSSSQQTANAFSSVINFNNADFSGATSGGTAQLNASGVVFGPINNGNLGAMNQFAIGTGIVISGPFRLMVTFTLPFTASHIFDATIDGTDGSVGTATIHFTSPTFQLFRRRDVVQPDGARPQLAGQWPRRGHHGHH